MDKATAKHPAGSNGNLVIGSPSSMNKLPWWQVGYHRLSRQPYPSIESDFGRAGDLAVAAVSIAGNKNRFKGTANQDAYALVHASESCAWLALAVCDGVSSAAYAEYGSRRLARATVRVLGALCRDEVVADIQMKAAESYLTTALVNANALLLNFDPDAIEAPFVQPAGSIRPEDLSSTITCAMIATKPGADGRYRAYVACIGDSPVFQLKSRFLEPLMADVMSHDLLETATDALPTREHAVMPRIRSLDCEAGAALIFVTDGIGTAIGDGQSEVGYHLAETWRRPHPEPEFSRFIAAANYDRRGEDDDRTAVVVWFPPFVGASSASESAVAATLRRD